MNSEIQKILNKIKKYNDDICLNLTSIINERRLINDKISSQEVQKIKNILNKYKNDRFFNILQLTPLSINNPHRNILHLKIFLKNVRAYLIDFDEQILPIIIDYELINYDKFIKNNPYLIKKIMLLQYKYKFPFNLYQILKNNCDIDKNSTFNHIDNIAFMLDRYFNTLVFDKKEMFEEGMFYQMKYDLNTPSIEENINKLLNI